MAESYSRFAEERERYELEDRLRDSTAPLPERIKAAWEMHGKSWDWERGGPVVNIPEPLCRLSPLYEPEEAFPYVTFRFHKEVTRTKDLEVTRVHCMGVTVKETYARPK